MRACATSGCLNEATMRCPTCKKLEIENDSYFCSQDCFKQSWSSHKKIHKGHKKAAVETDDTNPWPGYRFSGSLRPYPVTPRLGVPEAIEKPDYADHPEGEPTAELEARADPIKILTDEEIEAMRVVGKLARECLDEVAAAIDVGMTTDALDKILHQAAVDRDCYPSPLNYRGFPKSCCSSVNEVICHGIPDTRPLQDGDICNFDITVYHRGFHGDLNETFTVGNVDEESVKLIRVTHEALSKAIATVRPGVLYRELGNTIQHHVGAHGYSVVRSYCGHGIHRHFHTAPSVPHYAKNKAMGTMKKGHCFTIEPMISQGTHRDKTWPDNWTAVTEDGKRSAQFEQTLLVTETGCDILTARLKNNGQPYFMDKL